MKIFLKDLANIADEKKYLVDIKKIECENNLFIFRIENVVGDFTFYYDVLDKLKVNYQISGNMICPDAISLEETPVDFDLTDDLYVVNNQEDDGLYLQSDIELADLVKLIVLPEVPIKVVKNEEIEYSRGDGWAFVSEEDLASLKEEHIDERLQKLTEIKLQEDD